MCAYVSSFFKPHCTPATPLKGSVVYLRLYDWLIRQSQSQSVFTDGVAKVIEGTVRRGLWRTAGPRAKKHFGVRMCVCFWTWEWSELLRQLNDGKYWPWVVRWSSWLLWCVTISISEKTFKETNEREAENCTVGPLQPLWSSERAPNVADVPLCSHPCRRYMKHKRDDGAEKQDEETVDVTPIMICVFVVMCCSMLVLLYFFYDHLGTTQDATRHL